MSKKFLFIIQGNGKGHSTQAVAVKQLIEESGHSVVRAIIGEQKSNTDNAFFLESFGQNIAFIKSPNFVYDKDGSLSLTKTTKEILSNLLGYYRSLREIDRIIKVEQPDVVISFYEPLWGIFRLLNKNKRFKSFVVGHQFMFLHPGYIKLKKFKVQYFCAKFLTWLCGLNSKKLALSFYRAENYKDIVVIPPILREEIFELTPQNKAYALSYLMNEALIPQFTDDNMSYWGEIHVFTNTKTEQLVSYAPKITVHPLSNKKFLKALCDCDTLVCTAGFESVSEAAYLGKKTLTVPIPNHMEQYYNAKDAEKSLNSLFRRDFDVNRSKNIVLSKEKTQAFKTWVDSGTGILREILGL